jgi:hypothetical protein
MKGPDPSGMRVRAVSMTQAQSPELKPYTKKTKQKFS